MRGWRLGLLMALGLVVAGACSPAAPTGQPGGEQPVAADQTRAAPAGQPSRTMVIAARVEPAGLESKLLMGQANTRTARRLLNASLTLIDDQGVTRPYLATALPSVNTDSWRVFPDGRMETTYALRPNLTWHDGTPLSSEDFVFSYLVQTDPETGPLWATQPQNLMEEVLAPDPRTLVIRWRDPYPEADSLGGLEFNPLPRHILGSQFQRDKGDAFANHPFWNQEYVGLGPYKLDRWEPGVFMDLSAFDGHALGRPKIDRVHFVWISDPNTALANLLSGDLHIAVNDAIRFQQGSILQRTWGTGPGSGGTVLQSAREVRFIQIQLRPEVQTQKGFFDVRVRRALAHAVDKQALVDGLLDGQGTIANTFPSPQMKYYPALLSSVPKYLYDPRRADQFMEEAGFPKGASGFYTSATGGERFTADFRAFAGGQEESELAIMVDGLRRIGYDLTSTLVPEITSRDLQMRATFPSLTANVTQLGERTILNKLEGFNIPTAENRWAGFNRGAWANAEFDRLDNRFMATLDRAQRDQFMIQMMKIVNDEVGVVPLYYNLDAVAHVAALKGPTPSSPDTLREWNVYEWEWQS